MNNLREIMRQLIELSALNGGRDVMLATFGRTSIRANALGVSLSDPGHSRDDCYGWNVFVEDKDGRLNLFTDDTTEANLAKARAFIVGPRAP